MTNSPSPETTAEVQDRIRKIVNDAGYVAPELQVSWWTMQLTNFAGFVWTRSQSEVFSPPPADGGGS